MAAAPADFRPKRAGGEKIHREGSGGFELDLEATEDILASLAARRRDESDDRRVRRRDTAPSAIARAREKLERKGVGRDRLQRRLALRDRLRELRATRS